LLSRFQILNAGYHLTRSPHQSVDVTEKIADVLLDPRILLALISGDTEAMKNLLCATESFLDIHGIALNAAKTVFSRRIPENDNLAIKGILIGQIYRRW
jgi:hypothetical protein